MFRLYKPFCLNTQLWYELCIISYGTVIYSSYQNCIFRMKMDTKPKHVADDKFLIKSCLDIFISFIKNIFEHDGDVLLKNHEIVSTRLSVGARTLLDSTLVRLSVLTTYRCMDE
jgi:hypothetical protein